MAKRHSKTYTIMFVAAVSVIFAFALSFTASALRQRIQANERLEIRRNILECFGVFGSPDLPARNKASIEEIDNFFSTRLKSIVVNSAGDEIKCDVPVAKLKPWKELKEKGPGEVRLPLYILKAKDSAEAEAYGFPIWGKGLWGPIFGYMALESDGSTVRGITFYKHKETPGLGAGMENPSWRKKWRGKNIFDAKDKLTPIEVIKGKAAAKYEGEELSHKVDGLSGATLTSKGITDMVGVCLRLYEPFFRRIRTKRKGN